MSGEWPGAFRLPSGRRQSKYEQATDCSTWKRHVEEKRDREAAEDATRPAHIGEKNATVDDARSDSQAHECDEGGPETSVQ
jgi:hypothetical protein